MGVVRAKRIYALFPRAFGFVENERGSIAILFALSLFPALLLVGGALDYQLIKVVRHSALRYSADEALLAAMQVARTESAEGHSNWSSTAAAVGQLRFGDSAKGVPGASPSSANLNFSVSGVILTGKIDYAVSTPTIFLKLINPLTGTASSSVNVAQYTDIHVVIDISKSSPMNWGSDPNFVFEPVKMTDGYGVT